MTKAYFSMALTRGLAGITTSTQMAQYFISMAASYAQVDNRALLISSLLESLSTISNLSGLT